MRVQIPPGGWGDPTRASMFARGRLLAMDEYPPLGPRFAAPRSAAPPEQNSAAAETTPAAAGAVSDAPVPRPKDGGPQEPPLPEVPAAAAPDADCDDLAAAGVVGDLMPPVEETPAGCSIPHPVKVTAIDTSVGRITLRPAGLMRCAAARAVAAWVREDVVAIGKEKLGGELKTLQTASSFVCRPRNHVQGAVLSEHGLGNALDVSGFAFADGRTFTVGGKDDDKGFVQAVRAAACKHLTTVLGPGTDVEHGNHLHVDLKIRKGGYRICQ